MMRKLTVDKSDWGNGPWLNEPDKLMWYDTATGLRCMIRRGRPGSLNGYVRIPQGHPWYKLHYDRFQYKTSVHGGLTFSGKFRDEDGWWIGFDCGHSMDFSPRMAAIEAKFNMPFMDAPLTYRTIGYVRGQCEELAKQVDVAAVARVRDKVGLRYAVRAAKRKKMELKRWIKSEAAKLRKEREARKVIKFPVTVGETVAVKLLPDSTQLPQ